MSRLFPVVVTVICVAQSAYCSPKMLAYSASPNAWFDEHAAETAQLYDGFFFSIGSWDGGVTQCIGLPDAPAADPTWRERVKSNLLHLREAGATESLLAICFGESEPWPSPDTLRSKDFTAKMARHFGAAGQAARELGFRGVSIDVEYPYPRYSLDHSIYTYEGYIAEDLMNAAAEQGRACMRALLDAFPDAVVFLLPGELGGVSICGAFTLAMLDVMAERDAPGGLHLGYERSYCLLDPASQVAVARVADCATEHLLRGPTLAYWKKRCTEAPGVWPLHMVETGGQGYPVRPWDQELAELKQQMATLRSVAKRYVWSYSGVPVWMPASAELRSEYQVARPTFDNAEAAISGWHEILKNPGPVEDARLKDLVKAAAAYDEGTLNANSFCARFGTPADWLILGYLGNPFTAPAYSAPSTADFPINKEELVQGRDGAVRWFAFHNNEPTGYVRLRAAFGNRATDNCSVQLACTMTAENDVDGVLWLNFDDGGIVKMDGEVLLDKLAYPKKGHGLQYKDRYLFEYQVPVTITKGNHTLMITSVNSHGVWGVCMRFADADGYPLSGLSFALP